MKYYIFFLFPFFVGFESLAQSGCTDPQATNYDASATTNDGSCNYDLTEYTMTELNILPELLKECSGLAWVDGALWTHNDGGNEDKVYRIDTLTGAVLHSVTIATADNKDWEDLASNSSYLYIADVGNNLGNRTDLGILRIAKNDLVNPVVNADLISYEYSDQSDFSENSNNNNFDCEALVFYKDSLHLFTKNWVDLQTKHYVLPATPGTHVAQLVETFDVGMLVTGADVTEDNELVLLGYNTFGFSFVWLLFDYQDSYFFSGNKRRISLGFGTINGQTEGIALRGDGRGFVCSENFSVNGQVLSNQKLLSFTIDQWLDYMTSTQPLDASYQILAYPNPFQDFIKIELTKPIDHLRLYDIHGHLLRQQNLDQHQLTVELDTLEFPAGTYLLEIVKDGKTKTIPLVKN